MYIYKRFGSRGRNIVFVHVPLEHVHDAHPLADTGTKIYFKVLNPTNDRHDACYTKIILYRFDSRGFYTAYLIHFAD